MEWKTHTLKIALLTFFIVAVCLAAAPGIAVTAEKPDAKKLASIESIVPTGEGPATELTIKLTSPAVFTSHKTTSPLRLVIDFTQVTTGNVSAPVLVNKGNFKKVTAERFDTEAGVLTRVEIELVNDDEAVISSNPASPGEYKVSFPEFTGNVSPSAAKENADKLPAVTEPPVAASAPAPGNGAQIHTLTAVSVNKNIITLALDGAISDFKAFRLNKPERYVVDLMNVKSGLSTRLLPLNVSGVASARIGLYPDKVRVVFDSINGSFPEATAVKTDSGVVITLDAANTASTQGNEPAEGKITSQAKAEAPADEQPEAVVKPEPAKPAVSDKLIPKKPNQLSRATAIEMIDFQVVNGISRVSVKANGYITVDQPAKTPGYVTLIIKNAALPKKLQRSLETRSFVSPVLRVTPLAVKTKKSTDTKIRIAIRVDAPFEYRQEGDMFYIDFKHPEGLAGDKLIIEATSGQKRPPVLQKYASATGEDISSDLSVPESAGKTVTPSRGYKGRKVTLEFADAEVRKIFQLLSEVSNKNFVLGDDVTGAISLKLVNVPWDQALDIILDTKGLDKREDGNIILIKGKGK
ncbi:MAG: AMIN domain-containing protein, partial [Desulfuromonadaceae bacterium]